MSGFLTNVLQRLATRLIILAIMMTIGVCSGMYGLGSGSYQSVVHQFANHKPTTGPDGAPAQSANAWGAGYVAPPQDGQASGDADQSIYHSPGEGEDAAASARQERAARQQAADEAYEQRQAEYRQAVAQHAPGNPSY